MEIIETRQIPSKDLSAWQYYVKFRSWIPGRREATLAGKFGSSPQRLGRIEPDAEKNLAPCLAGILKSTTAKETLPAKAWS